MDGFPTPVPSQVYPEGVGANSEDNSKRSLTKLVELSQSILAAIQAGLSVSWGTITGTLSNQADLQAELDIRPERSAYQPVTSADGGSVSFANNSMDQFMVDDGPDPASGIGTLTVILPSNASSKISQECTYARSNNFDGTITFDQSGGGLVRSPAGQFLAFSSITVSNNMGAIITWQKVAANTWAIKQAAGNF